MIIVFKEILISFFLYNQRNQSKLLLERKMIFLLSTSFNKCPYAFFFKQNKL